ncbi:MAG TPA: PaaI family thioesterase [Caulobacteraceae bacterium]|nr:PaaI family thioesterase [Caulobacteraceae bacterium]
MAEGNEFAGGTRPITEGEWAGWRNWGPDAWEDMGGPFVYRVEDGGRVRCAFRAEAKHMNGGGFMHGGALMTFADYALFCIATDELDGSKAVTLSFNSEFIATAKVGDLIEATGEVVRAGRSVIFIRGEIFTGARMLMTFSGVLKRVDWRG